MSILYFDTETQLIENNKVPDLICLQYAVDEETPTITKDFDARFIEALQQCTKIVGHNICFDFAVLVKAGWIDKNLVWSLFKNNRVEDTQIIEQLQDIATGFGMAKGALSLGYLASVYCNISLDKSDASVRYRFSEVASEPVDQWPEEFVKYASEDIVATRSLYKYQKRKFRESPDQHLQTCCAWILYDTSHINGIKVDTDRAYGVLQSLQDEQTKLRDQLLGAGLLKTSKKGFTADTSILQQRVVAACAAAGKKVKLTNSGKTQTSKDVIQDIAEFDSLLTTYQTYKKHEKNISTYLTPLATSGGRLHTSANVLVATGRTSWREPSLQVFPGVPGIRESFLPEDGHYLLSVDYDSLELRVLSQCLLWIVGKSAMAEGYIKDPGFDPHSKVGAILAGTTYEEFLKNKDTNPTYDKLRKMAKAANFGFAGGMGVDSFIDFAKTYKVLLDRQGVWKLKNAYFKAYPEMKEYFVYVNEMINREVAFQQLPSGRLRGGVGFCDGCNTFFQGGAADGAKLAMAHIYNQSLAKGTTLFGTKMVAFIHDEFLLSTPKETAHEAAQEVVDIMETKMRAVFPDIPFKASPALMTCWIKAAKAKYSNGRLVPYDNGRGD